MISCGVHAFLLVRQPVACGLVSRDSDEYWRIAGNLLAGNGYSYDGENPTRMRQPLYPLFLAAVRAISGDSVTAVLVTQSALDLLALLLLAALATYALGPQTAAMGTLLISLYVPVAILSCQVLTETLYTVLLYASVLCWVSSIQSRHLSSVLCLGGLTGLCALCRPAGLPVLLLLPLVLWLQTGRARRMIVVGFAATVTGLMVMAPWAVRNYLVLGDATVVSTDVNTALWLGVHPMMTSDWPDYTRPFFELEEFKSLTGGHYYLSRQASERLAEAARQRIRQDPLGVIQRGLWKVGITWTYLPGTRPLAATSPWLFRLARVPQILMLLLAVVGAFNSPSSLWSTLLVLCLSASAGLFLGPATARYVIPVMPSLLILDAAALERWRAQRFANSVAASERTRERCEQQIASYQHRQSGARGS